MDAMTLVYAAVGGLACAVVFRFARVTWLSVRVAWHMWRRR